MVIYKYELKLEDTFEIETPAIFIPVHSRCSGRKNLSMGRSFTLIHQKGNAHSSAEVRDKQSL